MAEVQLEPPTSCDNCASFNIELVTNDRLYGTRKGKWPYVWRCVDCNASVGCHPNTFNPLGRMAGKTTRLLRREAHAAFDQLWLNGLMARSNAYRWLAEQLGIPLMFCHISMMTNKQLRYTIEVSKEHYERNKHIAERRNAKRQAKRVKAREYEKQRIQRRKFG